jgi:hypothetical protein
MTRVNKHDIAARVRSGMSAIPITTASADCESEFGAKQWSAHRSNATPWPN